MQKEEFDWFALRVRSRHEKVVGTALVHQGYESLVPLYTKTRRWRNRNLESDLPLFPGYVFCAFDPRQRLPILKTVGVIEVIGFGGTPYPVDRSEIAALQNIVASGVTAEPWPFLEAGQHVEITCGPLAGTHGIFEKLHSTHRLIVSVTLLQRSVSVQIQSDWVRPMATDLQTMASRAMARAAAN